MLPEIADGKVVSRYRLGPSELTGRVVSTAQATRAAGRPRAGRSRSNFTSEGGKQFDDLAKAYYQQSIAIVLDGVVKSAPKIQDADSTARPRSTAAAAASASARPRTSPSCCGTARCRCSSSGRRCRRCRPPSARTRCGRPHRRHHRPRPGPALHARSTTGPSGMVVLLGLARLGACCMYSIVTLLGETSGLALSLAGATGIIVSVGVTVDSYVVYFERLKDEIRSGKTLRSSVDRGFTRAYRTILAADTRRSSAPGCCTGSPSARCGASPSSSGCRRCSTSSSPTSSPGRSCRSSGRSRFFTEARWFGVARGLAAARREVRRDATDDRPSAASGTGCTTARRRSTSSAAAAVVHRSRPSSSSSASSRSALAGLNFGIDFEGGTSWEVRGHERLGHGGPRRDGERRAAATPRSSASAARRSACRPTSRGTGDRAPGASRQGHRQAGRARQGVDRRRQRQRRRAVVGRRDLEQGPARAHLLLPRHLRLHHASGSSGRWRWPRWPPWCTTSSSPSACTPLRLRGHAGDGHRLPHHPRLLAVRHHRRVRQGRGEHRGPGRVRAHDLRRHGEPVDEPGADAVAEHLAGGHPADPVDAGRRRVRARRDDARGLRPGPAHRPAHRRLLVDLHRLAGPRHAQGARAALRRRSASGWRPAARAAARRSRRPRPPRRWAPAAPATARAASAPAAAPRPGRPDPRPRSARSLVGHRRRGRKRGRRR